MTPPSLPSGSLQNSHSGWHPDDQRIFYTGICKLKRELEWKPQINVETGVRKLFDFDPSSFI